jgi:hypothetical protein
MRLLPTTNGEHLPAMLLITDQVSESLPHVSLLLVQQQDTVPDPVNVVSFLDVERHHRAKLHPSENTFATIQFEVPV